MHENLSAQLLDKLYTRIMPFTNWRKKFSYLKKIDII